MNTVTLNRFKKSCAKSGQTYIISGKAPALRVKLQFTGKLNSEEVLWDAEFQTLASYHNEQLAGQSEKQRAREVYSFLEIQEPSKQVAKLHVVLATPLIDEPTIKKTIIMIRCYKRLKIGKHVFGKNL